MGHGSRPPNLFSIIMIMIRIIMIMIIMIMIIIITIIVTTSMITTYCIIIIIIIIRAPLHFKADLQVKLNVHSLDLIFRSIRVQIRITRGQNSQTQAFAYFQTRSFSTVACACARGCMP